MRCAPRGGRRSRPPPATLQVIRSRGLRLLHKPLDERELRELLAGSFGAE